MNADAPDYSLKLVEALNGVFDIHVNLPTPIISTVVSSWGNTRGCKSTVNGFIPIKIDKKKMKRCA
jgi:hypothetical protein